MWFDFFGEYISAFSGWHFPEYLQQTFFMSTPGISISYSSMFQPQLAETIPRAKKRRPKPAEISHNNAMPQNIFSGWQHSKAVQHSPGRSELPRYPTSVADSRVGWPWRDSAKVQLTAFLVLVDRLWSMDCCSLLPEVICWNDFLWTNSFHVFGGVEFLENHQINGFVKVWKTTLSPLSCRFLCQALGRLTGINADSDQFHIDFKEVEKDSTMGGSKM